MKRAQNPLVCHGHTRPIVELSFSPVTPDGYFLTSASKDGQPMLRNGATGDWIGTFQGHKGAVWSCTLNEPALLAVTASADFSARVWDAVSGEEKHHWQHKHIVRTAAFARTAPRLCTAGYEALLRIYDLQRPDAEPAQYSGASDKVRCVAWHQADVLLLTSSLDRPGISVWDMRAPAIVRTLETKAVVTSIEVQPDGRHITTADGSEVRFWDGGTLQPLKSFTQPHPTESATLCYEKRRFAAGGVDMWVHLFDYDTGEELECNKGHHGPVHTVRFAPGGQTYASGSEDGTIRIWETDYSAKDEGGAEPRAPAPAANGVNGTASA